MRGTYYHQVNLSCTNWTIAMPCSVRRLRKNFHLSSPFSRHQITLMHIATEVPFSNTQTRALRFASITHVHIHIGCRISWMHLHGVSHSSERKARFYLTIWASYSYYEQSSRCCSRSYLYVHLMNWRMITFQRMKKQSAPLLIKLQPLLCAPQDARKSEIRFLLLDACSLCSKTSGTLLHPIYGPILRWDTYSEGSENASEFNVSSVGMVDPRNGGSRDGMDALGVQGNQIRRYIHSFDDA